LPAALDNGEKGLIRLGCHSLTIGKIGGLWMKDRCAGAVALSVGSVTSGTEILKKRGCLFCG